MHESRSRGPSAGAVGSQRVEDPLDDWLGDVSDEDWNEPATAGAERAPARADSREAVVARGEPRADRTAAAPPIDAADAHRAVIERRRLVAVVVMLLVLGVGVGAAVLLFRGGDETQTTSVSVPTTTPTAPSESSRSSTPSESSTTPSTTSTTPSTTTPSTTTPPTNGASGFTLPEGTKLQRGEDGDPALITQLQQALSAAGYNPGTADGVFGRQTEAAVVAFQQDNDLSVDGRVGPETAAALNSALAGG